MKVTFAIVAIFSASLGLNIFLWNQYKNKECIEQHITNVVDTMYQAFYVPTTGMKVNKPGVSLNTITNALNASRKGSIMFSAGINYTPNVLTPYSYSVGIMYFRNSYGIGYEYNPWLQSHQLKVGFKLGN